MKITEIIQDALIFPSKNIGSLAIYVVLSILCGTIAFGILTTSITKFIGLTGNLILGIIYLVISLVILFVMSGYQLSIVKSGIEQKDESPDFNWNENLNDGLKNVFVSLVYCFIPFMTILTVAFINNVPNKIVAVFREMISVININRIMGNAGAIIYNTAYPTIENSSAIAYNSIAPTIENTSIIITKTLSTTIESLVIALAITFIVAVILIIITSFILAMAEARLANTDSLEKALDLSEALRDMKRIGIAKVIGLIISLVLIILVIEIIASTIFDFAPALSIFSIVITPYLVFFVQRAIGLLYSDIA